MLSSYYQMIKAVNEKKKVVLATVLPALASTVASTAVMPMNRAIQAISAACWQN